tara:strand:- start:1175 stop:1777 length:603 start_codon:yes stop_codon:yes gene_type:complete
LLTEINSRYGIGNAYLEQWAPFITYEEVLDQEHIQKLLDVCDNAEFESAVTGKQGGISEDETMRKSQLHWIRPNSTTTWIYDNIGHYIQECNTYRYRMDIAGFGEPLQLTKYPETGGHYDWHMDIGEGRPSLRKLSFSLILQNAEEGGEMQFNTAPKIQQLAANPGTLIIFPSYIMHRVAPVTQGERISLVGWVGGDHYR